MSVSRYPCLKKGRGFSLVEALIAMALLLTIVLGVLPLFSRSMIENLSGKESTIAANHGKATLEALYQLPLDRVEVTIPGGSTTLQTTDEWCHGYGWDNENDPGTDDCDPLSTDWDNDGVLWSKANAVQFYSISDIYDGDREFNNPMDGNTPPGFAHVWELSTIITGTREGALGPARSLDLLTLRGF